MSPTTLKKSNPVRQYKRYSYPSDLVVTCEGTAGNIPLTGPDLGAHGMFINTPAALSEGTVLKLAFRLARTNVKISVRGEVRYRMPGVGVGVEFIDIPDETRAAIEQELEQQQPEQRSEMELDRQ